MRPLEASLKNILFIVNPISGGKRKAGFPEAVDKYLDREKFSARIFFTQHAGHAREVALEELHRNDIIVAVGGDGTINEIANVLEGTGKVMGIIPWGSGNGLARSLGIPIRQKEALCRLNDLNISKIDSAVFNGQKFFNIAGMGFDAHISTLFANHETRGFSGYIKTAFAEISAYLPQHYKIEIDGTIYERDAFMLSIANSSQYGNNAHISPAASVRDGLLDVCIIRQFPLYRLPEMGMHMFIKTAHKSAFVEIIRGRSVKIIREAAGPVHLDGEPVNMGSEITIEIKPLGLQVLI